MTQLKSYNGNPYVKADGVQHSFTEHEVKEYIKCMNDVSYFCKNYVKVISLDKGLVNFELRGYQEKMVKHFNDNRFNIVLACRQSGKCSIGETEVTIRFLDGPAIRTKIALIHEIFYALSMHRMLLSYKYDLPNEQIFKDIFSSNREAQMLFVNIWRRASYHSKKLWWKQFKGELSDADLKGAFYSSSFISEDVFKGKGDIRRNKEENLRKAQRENLYRRARGKYKNKGEKQKESAMPLLRKNRRPGWDVEMPFRQLSPTEKFVESFEGFGFYIETDSGFRPLKQTHKTVKYTVWKVKTDCGKTLYCADDHILFGENMTETFVKDLRVGSYIEIKGGSSRVALVKPLGYDEDMYDLGVDFEDHRFYTNDILSHNSVTSVAWLLHYVIFNGNKKVGILANKGATAREMLARFTLMLENLPFFLQPGVKILNKGNIVFSNNSEIIAAATSGSSIRGLSLNCVTGDTKIDIFDGKDYCSKNISELHNSHDEYVTNKNWRVKSEDGIYRRFDGVKKSQVDGYYILSFSNGAILKITGDHLIKTKEGYVKAELLCETHLVCTSVDGHYTSLVGSLFINEKVEVYDLVNVLSTRNFFANGLLIHNCIFLDEFAFVHKAEEFYTSTYPVISSGEDTKVIITSTPNGVGNMFYKLWEGAIQKASAYKAFTIKWQDVPGRDEAWRSQTIANTSELQFNQEYNCDFLGSAQTLINANTLLGLQASKAKKIQYDITYYEEPVPGHEYVLTADVSKGRGQDYSTYSVIDISTQPFRQVCTYRNNTISPLLFPDMIIRAAQIYNKALVIVENNDAGMVVCNAIYYDHEYENTFTTSSVKSNGIGVTMSKKVKRIGCSNLKDLIENGKLHVVDAETIIELSSFSPKGDSFAGSDGTHDDCVMNLVLFSWFVSTDMFKSLSNVDLKELLYRERLMEIEEDVLPFGFIDSNLHSHTHYDDMIEDIRRWNDL